MRYSMICAAALLGGSLIGGSAQSAEIKAHAFDEKSNSTVIGLELDANEAVAAADIVLDLGKLPKGSVDTTQCLSELPAGFASGCRFDGQFLRVIVGSVDGESVIPHGLLGTVEIKSAVGSMNVVSANSFRLDGSSAGSSAGRDIGDRGIDSQQVQ